MPSFLQQDAENSFETKRSNQVNVLIMNWSPLLTNANGSDYYGIYNYIYERLQLGCLYPWYMMIERLDFILLISSLSNSNLSIRMWVEDSQGLQSIHWHGHACYCMLRSHSTTLQAIWCIVIR